MSQSLDPVNISVGLPRAQKQWAQSLHTVINGGIDMGTVIPGGLDATGTPANFAKGNSDGVLVRIGASGSSNGPKYNWTTSGTGIVIQHGLGRQPIGFKLVDCDGQLQVWRTAVADATQITLAPSDATKNVTVYIF